MLHKKQQYWLDSILRNYSFLSIKMSSAYLQKDEHFNATVEKTWEVELGYENFCCENNQFHTKNLVSWLLTQSLPPWYVPPNQSSLDCLNKFFANKRSSHPSLGMPTQTLFYFTSISKEIGGALSKSLKFLVQIRKIQIPLPL